MATSTVGHEPPSDPRPRDPFFRRTLLVLLLAAAVALLAILLAAGIDILLAAFGGILIAVFLRALVDVLKRVLPLSDGAALAMVLLLLTSGLGIGGWLLYPQVSRQADELAERIPEVTGEIVNFLGDRTWGRWLLSQAGQAHSPGPRPGDEDEADEGDDVAGIPLPDGAAAGAGGLISAVSTWSTYFLTALFVGLFAAVNPGLYRDGVVHLVPVAHRPRAREILDRLGYVLRRWLIGQLISMVLIGVSTMIVLWVFAVPLAVILGLIVGLLGFIPYLGPILGLVPVVLIAATQDMQTLLYVVLAYTGVQILEGYVANPLIHQGTVHLPPATTVSMQMLLGAVVGVIGIVFATPLAAVLLVLSQFYRRDVLGDSDAEL
jgi:predicted PurR-regulated permease PerM